MSFDGGYDMILLPPPRDNDNGGRQPARRRRNRRRLPRVMEEQPPRSSRPLPRRRRGRQGNQGQAGGSASSAVERVDSAGTPTGGAPGIDFALETKTSAVSPRHANPEQADDASTLAKSLLDVTLVPETTMHSVPDVTSSPPVDQEEWAGQPPAGEVRHLPQGIQHRITDDVRVRPPPTSSGVGQNLATTAMLLRAMLEPSTSEGRRIQGELKNLLEDAAVRRAESSASRR